MKSFYQRVKDKKLRDFVVYFKRKYYLKKVKRAYATYGDRYFFSNNYISKHLNCFSRENVGELFRTQKVGLLGDIDSTKSRLRKVAKENPTIFASIFKSADRIIKHDFDLLGSNIVNLNFPVNVIGIFGVKLDMQITEKPIISNWLHEGYQPIDWHIDFKSGYRWIRSEFYPESRNYSQIKGADIKVPWELSRCQHLPMVALAYMIDENPLYANEVTSQIIDWIDNNPFCKGPNWNCPMDVGIRAANWLVALEMIRGFHDENNNAIYHRILISIVQHLDYLRNNFEWTSKLTSNHYLSDIAGFLFCVIYTPNLKRKSKYLKFIKNEFEVEISKQMYKDGMNSEGSVPYHRLVLELFSYSSLLAEKNAIRFNQEFYKRLENSFKFTSAILKKDGSVPQIGDNDSGVFFKFFERPLEVHNYLLSIAECIFHSPYLNSDNSEMLESALFENQVRPNTLEMGDEKNARHFIESGLICLKSDELYLTVYNGKNGQKGNGGHCHNDRNSITLQWKGVDILEDAGTGIYTPFPDIRNKFRATESHNTVSIIGVEQNRFYEDGYLFGMHEDVTKATTEMQRVDGKVFINGMHNGYSKNGLKLEHRRNIVLDNWNTVTIIDQLGCSEVEKHAFFLIKKTDDVVFENNSVMAKNFEFIFSGFITVSYDNWGFSSSYGVIVPDYFMRVKIMFRDELKSTIILK